MFNIRNNEIKKFVEVILFNDVLCYNTSKMCLQFNINQLFKHCFPGVDLEHLDFPTATLLVQKEMIKARYELYTVKEIDEMYFKANKAAWVFSVLFDSDIVLEWYFLTECPPKNAVQERSWEHPKLNAGDFFDIFRNSPYYNLSDGSPKDFEMVLNYLVYGVLERPIQSHRTNIGTRVPYTDFTSPPDFDERRHKCARFARTAPSFMWSYSGSDDSTCSLLFGIKEEDGDCRKPFKSCIPPSEEYMVKHLEQGGLCRVISVDDDNFSEHENALRSLLDGLKDWPQHRRRRVDDKHTPLEEFEKVLGQIRYLYGLSPSHPIEKEDGNNVKQDKPKEKPAYGIQFYICQPYQGKYSK